MYIQGEGIISREDFIDWLEKNRDSFGIVRNNKKVVVYNIPAAFDIETSSFYSGEEKTAIMYLWQFGIYNKVTIGRTWEEFEKFIKSVIDILELGNDKNLYVYVHNLPYEFQFIRKRLKWEKVFLIDDRKPVYASTSGIVFRCSLKLSGGRSLYQVSKELHKYKVKKLTGYLDYSKLRTPETPLTEKEYKYGENDVRVILSYIQEKIEQDGDITKIPLTNTSYVRNYCRKAVYGRWKRYRRIMDNLKITPEEYMYLRAAFQGGFTHANSNYVGRVVSNVHSYDLTSSYPSVMVLEMFPMSEAEYIGSTSEDYFVEYSQLYCCLARIKLTGIVPKRYQDNPISLSKCVKAINPLVNNGRVVMADYIETIVTEQDYFVIHEFYEYDKIEIEDLRIYRKGYLPKDLVLSILGMYEKKTSLKKVKGMEVEYMISKNMINSCYGMMVTNPVRDELDYLDNEFIKRPPDIIKQIELYNDNIRRFLFYPWGVWVTAYARANLFSGIIELGNDYIYSDTDSLKFLNIERHLGYFKRYNEAIEAKINAVSYARGINKTLFMPEVNGDVYTIGAWDREPDYIKFKTLGAKRYLTLDKDNRLVITMAGVNKSKVSDWLARNKSPFELFNDGLVVPKEHSGRNILTYIDEERSGSIVDYTGKFYTYRELSGIHMEASEYEVGMANDFINYLKGIREEKD